MVIVGAEPTADMVIGEGGTTKMVDLSSQANSFYDWYRTQGQIDMPWLYNVPVFREFFQNMDRQKYLRDYHKNTGRYPAYISASRSAPIPAFDKGAMYRGARFLYREYDKMFDE